MGDLLVTETAGNSLQNIYFPWAQGGAGQRLRDYGAHLGGDVPLTVGGLCLKAAKTMRCLEKTHLIR